MADRFIDQSWEVLCGWSRARQDHLEKSIELSYIEHTYIAYAYVAYMHMIQLYMLNSIQQIANVYMLYSEYAICYMLNAICLLLFAN